MKTYKIQIGTLVIDIDGSCDWMENDLTTTIEANNSTEALIEVLKDKPFKSGVEIHTIDVWESSYD